MNRDEILAKSRKEKNDEGLREAQNKGRRIGTAAFACMVIVILDTLRSVRFRTAYDL